MCIRDSPRCALLGRGQHGLRPLAIGGQGYIAVGVIEIQVAPVCAAALEKQDVYKRQQMDGSRREELLSGWKKAVRCALTWSES